MTSKTSICNRALTKLGEERSIDIENDDNPRAQTMNLIYEDIRESELQAYFWTFAKKRVALAPLTTEPAFKDDFGVEYQLPSDFLCVYEIIGNPDFTIEGKKLLTNETTQIKLTYIANIENTTLFTPLFIEALACRLALEAAEEATQSNTKYERIANQYIQTIARARRIDAISLPLTQYNQDDYWLQVRG